MLSFIQSICSTVLFKSVPIIAINLEIKLEVKLKIKQPNADQVGKLTVESTVEIEFHGEHSV